MQDRTYMIYWVLNKGDQQTEEAIVLIIFYKQLLPESETGVYVYRTRTRVGCSNA